MMIKGEKMNLKNIIENLKMKYKNLNGNTKNILILVGILIILMLLTLWLVSGDSPNNEISNAYESTQIENNATEFVAPKLDNIFPSQNDSNATILPISPPFPSNNDSNATIPQEQVIDFNNPLNASAREQADIVNQIAKSQKPDNMIVFLKEAQSKFDFLKTQKQFKYELKNYEVGDIFLWWEIEEITPVYIRFKDKDYSYNLRFLDF